jgi:hypothetical protein
MMPKFTHSNRIRPLAVWPEVKLIRIMDAWSEEVASKATGGLASGQINMRRLRTNMGPMKDGPSLRGIYYSNSMMRDFSGGTPTLYASKTFCTFVGKTGDESCDTVQDAAIRSSEKLVR